MKKLFPVIHIENIEQVFQNIEICLSEGVQGIFLINHYSDNHLLYIANKVKEIYPNLWVGVNFLELKPSWVLNMEFKFESLWFDQTLTLEDTNDKKFQGEIFSGLNFKYQKQLYGSSLKDAIKVIKQTSTVACTSGPGTGIEADPRKIIELKNLLGDFPLALASGVSSENIETYLPYVDVFLVASSITNKNEIIERDLLAKLLSKVRN